MKNLIFTLFTIFLFSSLVAQVDREIVILEGGTGVTCPYCPGSAMALQDLYDNGDPVAAIEYHNYGAGPFNTPEAAIRTSYYGITGYPTMQFDGEWNQHVGGDPSQSMYSTYLPIVTSRMNVEFIQVITLPKEYISILQKQVLVNTLLLMNLLILMDV